MVRLFRYAFLKISLKLISFVEFWCFFLFCLNIKVWHESVNTLIKKKRKSEKKRLIWMNEFNFYIVIWNWYLSKLWFELWFLFILLLKECYEWILILFKDCEVLSECRPGLDESTCVLGSWEFVFFFYYYYYFILM